MSTRKVSIKIVGAGVAALALLTGGAVYAQAPNVPYGAPLTPPPGGGGPGGGFRGFGGFTIGQIATVTGSSFTVTAMDGSTVTIKTKPTTEIIKSTDSTVDAIKVGDTIQVGGRPDADNNIAARRITDGTVGIGFPGGGPRPGAGAPGAPPAGGAAPAPGAGGPGGGGRRFGGISGVVTILDPLTIKGADGTTYTVDTTNVQTVSMTTLGKIDDLVTGKYAMVIGAPPAPGADTSTPPTTITANRITISDTAPRFGRGGGGGRPGGGGGAGGGGAAAVQ